MGSRKNYKASVEVGSEVFHWIFLFCVCVIVLTSFFPPTVVIELLCHLWSQLHLCGLSVTESLFVSHNKTMLLQKALTTPVDRWHVSFHTKQEAESLSTGPPQSESENLPVFLWLTGSEFFMLMRKSEGLTPLKTIYLKQIVADWTFCLKSSHWNSPAFWTLVPRKQQTRFLYIW